MDSSTHKRDIYGILRGSGVYTDVVRHTKTPTAQTEHLVFTDTQAYNEKTKRAILSQGSRKIHYILCYVVNNNTFDAIF